MLIPLNDIKICYQKIIKKSLNGGTTVIIFVSYEVDSLCAAHILSVPLEILKETEFFL